MIKKFKEFMRDRGCVMIKVKVSNWNEICSVIKPEDVYQTEDMSHGIETKPHITVLYGLLTHIPNNDVLDVLRKFDVPTVEFHDKLEIFENDEFDVVKIGVDSGDLVDMNAGLKKLPHESTFPYRPHMTVAYLKKGTGKKYDGIPVELNDVQIRDVVYSSPNIKISMELNER